MSATSRLYEIELEKTLTVYAVAEDLEAAKRIAEVEVDWYESDVFASGCEVRPGGRVLADWLVEEPYGKSEGRTCEWWAQLTDEQIAERKAAEKAAAEFAAHPVLLEV